MTNLTLTKQRDRFKKLSQNYYDLYLQCKSGGRNDNAYKHLYHSYRVDTIVSTLDKAIENEWSAEIIVLELLDDFHSLET